VGNVKKEIRKKKSVRFLLTMAVFALALVLAACSFGDDPTTWDESKAQAIAAGEDLKIPVSEVSETVQFYPITVDGTRMEVLAVKASDGTIRTAFNTCQVCNGSPKAYFIQNGREVQCQNCMQNFLLERIEVEQGGCNPIPIFAGDKTETAETIAIPYDTLKANAEWFPANWKQ